MSYYKYIWWASMDKILNTLYNDIKNEDYYSAFYVALALVGTCSRKQYPELRRDRDKYLKWLENYYVPLYEKDQNQVLITAEAFYKFRCSLLHESTNELELKNGNIISKIIIVTTGSHRNCAIVKNLDVEIKEIIVDARKFLNEIYQSIFMWKQKAEHGGINTNCKFEIISSEWSSTEINGCCAFKNCR